MRKVVSNNKDGLLYGFAGLAVGVLLMGLVSASAANNSHSAMMNMMEMHDGNMMNGGGMSMDEMAASLKGKTGDDFDKAFIEHMIVHHQGAIDMANLAKQNAKHDEVKKLADDILAAQSKEIDMMQTWQSNWGYKDSPKSHMMQ